MITLTFKGEARMMEFGTGVLQDFKSEHTFIGFSRIDAILADGKDIREAVLQHEVASRLHHVGSDQIEELGLSLGVFRPLEGVTELAVSFEVNGEFDPARLWVSCDYGDFEGCQRLYLPGELRYEDGGTLCDIPCTVETVRTAVKRK